jgi:phosphoribosylaminoimidazole-succinocarboxamide synthase
MLRKAHFVQGKVRDTYDLGDKIVVITTDRQSAFDRLLASIPFKGQVLNQTAAWWFDQTEHIVSNAVISVPDPNVVVMKKCKVFPVEFVVRGFLTGRVHKAVLSAAGITIPAFCMFFLAQPALFMACDCCLSSKLLNLKLHV